MAYEEAKWQSGAAPGQVLVTGAAGFVGSHIVAVLSRAGYRVVGVDVAQPVAGALPTTFIECDVADAATLAAAIEEHSPDAIVHAAAITPGDDECKRAHQVLQVNLNSTLTVLTAAEAATCNRVVLLSSAGVYCDPEPGEALTEQSPVANDGGLYAQTKLASERLCRWASREIGVSTVALRVGPVYGEFERPTGSRLRMSPIHQAIGLAQAGMVITCNSAETVYNWIHGDDIGRAVLAALEAVHPERVYNVAGHPSSMMETMRLLAAFNRELRYEWASDPEKVNLWVGERSRLMSSALIRDHLGFEPSIPLADGIERVVRGCADETV